MSNIKISETQGSDKAASETMLQTATRRQCQKVSSSREVEQILKWDFEADIHWELIILILSLVVGVTRNLAYLVVQLLKLFFFFFQVVKLHRIPSKENVLVSDGWL